MNILVTGGSGFIGSAVVRHIVSATEDSVLNLDKLTYAGNPANLNSVTDSDRYQFVQGDICDREVVTKCLESFRPDAIMHLAA